MFDRKIFASFLIVFVIFSSLIVNINGAPNIPTYTAAVVEVKPVASPKTFEGVAKITKQAVAIIESKELNAVDIVVLPEGIFNQLNTSSVLPSTKNAYCDDPNADFVLQKMSCAARKAKIYVVINLVVNVKCTLADWLCCPNNGDTTHFYNMAIVFDRKGVAIAKYRKYHLFHEDGIDQPKKPDLTTFKTDFNVTFGIAICFDLMFADPMETLIQKGVKHFVYPTYWFSELPYLTSAQYQQGWAYANNVNLLAANVNAPKIGCSGSGIYSGQSGALQVFVSELPATKILVAKVPVDLPASSQTTKCQNLNKKLVKTRSVSPQNVGDISQDINLSKYSMKFLNFSDKLSQTGSVCNNNICCNYSIEVSDNGENKGKLSYSYAISVFNGLRQYKVISNLMTGQDVCSVIACAEQNSKESCGIEIPMQKLHNRYTFKKLRLETTIPVTHMKIMPNTLSTELIPLKTTEFDFKISEIRGANMYAAALSLIVPKIDLFTFAIFSRDYDRDVFGEPNGKPLNNL